MSHVKIDKISEAGSKSVFFRGARVFRAETRMMSEAIFLVENGTVQLPLDPMRPLASSVKGASSITSFANNVCILCRHHVSAKSSLKVSNIQQRHITQNWLRKKAEAKVAWDEQALEIQSGKKKSMMTVLTERGYINDCSP